MVGHCDAWLRIRPGVRGCRVRVDLGSERAQEAKGDELLDLLPVFVVCRERFPGSTVSDVSVPVQIDGLDCSVGHRYPNCCIRAHSATFRFFQSPDWMTFALAGRLFMIYTQPVSVLPSASVAWMSFRS